MALPQLELSDHHRSPFDEAVLIIGGEEEKTITIECDRALDLAHRLIIYVNAHAEIVKTLTAALHALRSYEFGNSAPELAHGIADELQALINRTEEAA
ncbi:hypothetical protein [Bradyrhizobium sp.]|uniref:hypothetical protein n=1 Tax=Bradyrhizobium sp. TaxID=376 RepID=UPI0039E227C8